MLKNQRYPKNQCLQYRKAHRHASCSAGILCRGYGVVTCNIQPSIYKKCLKHSRIAEILYNSHIIPLDLFFLHRRRSSYLRGIRFLQLCPVIEKSLNRAYNCRCSKMATKKIKLQWNSSSWHQLRIRCWGYQCWRWIWGRRREGTTEEASLGRRRNTGCNQWQITNLGLPQGRNTNIHTFIVPAKGVKNSEASYINKDSLSLFFFFTEIFHLLVEQINIYYQQHLVGQAGPSCWLPDFTLPDIMIFFALALQMGHELKDTLHDYRSRLRQLHTLFCGETMTRDRFVHILLLVRNLIEEAGKSQDHPTPRLTGRPSAATTNVVWLESHHNQHRPAKSSTHLRCHLCSFPGQRKGTVGKCARCDMGLCVVPCFV